MSNHVVILGGGIIGITSAWYLAQRGYQVTIIEKEQSAGLATSFANGGLLTPSMADPWAAPGLPLKLLRWMGREKSPFLLRPTALPGMMNWGLSFLRNCTDAQWRKNTEIIFRLAAYSQQATDQLAEQTGIEFDHSTSGTLRLFRDSLSIDNAKRGARIVGDLGCRSQLLTAAECIDVEPALAPQAEQLTGGIYFPDDGSGDAYKFTTALSERCKEIGVQFRYGVNIEGISIASNQVQAVQTDKGPVQGDHYVLALASASTQLMRSLGVKLPVYPVKGYSATLSIKGWNSAPTVPLVDDARKLAITRLGDRLRLAGTAEFNGFDRQLNPQRGRMLLDNLLEIFPDCPGVESTQHWTGLRPMTPDGIPVIGNTPFQNLFINTGQGHLGFTMACGSAKVLTDIINDKQPDISTQGLGLR